MGKCIAGELWNSRLNGQPDGQFVITHIDQGNFSGTHGGDPINGRCTGNAIHYTRAGKGHYSGTFHGDNEIRGVHSSVARLRKRKVLTDDDDWVGTHT